MSTIVEVNGNENEEITVGVNTPEVDVNVYTDQVVHNVEIKVDEFAAQTANDAADRAEQALEDIDAAIAGKTDRGGYPGTSQDIVNLIEDAQLPDTVLKYGDIITDDLNVHVSAADFQWRINKVNFLTASEYDDVIDPATDNFYRTDALLGNNAGGYQILKGIEDPASSSEPTELPTGTIRLGLIHVFGATITTVIVDVSGFITKASKGFIRLLYAGNVDVVPVDDKSYLKFEPGMLSLKSLQIDDPNNIYHGRDFIIKNGTTLPVTIPHNLGTGNFKFNFPTGNDLIIKPEESVHIVMRAINSTNNGGFLDYVGVAGVEIINDLITGGTNKALSAEMGKNLNATKQPNLTDSNFGAFQSVLPTVTTISDTDKMPFLIGSLSRMMSWLTFKSQFKTVNSNSLFGIGNIVTPDMDTTTAQEVTGVKTFRNGMFGFRNFANTFTSFFINTNTASRTYTFQNRNGTIADDTDLAGKMNNPTGGLVSYLPKFLTANTLGLSRLWDTGFFFGLGTSVSPSKDFTLGNQLDREIGIEESDANTRGRDLSVTAGRTNDYLLTTMFTNLSTLQSYLSIAISPAGDIYLLKTGNVIVKQTAATGPFVSIGATFSPTPATDIANIAFSPNGEMYAIRDGVGITVYLAAIGSTVFNSFAGINYIKAICAGPNNDAYTAIWFNGDIFKRVAGSGGFAGLGQTSRAWYALCQAPNLNVYAAVNLGDIYMQSGGAGPFNPTGQTSRSWSALCAAPNGNVYAAVNGGDIYMQSGGIGAFNPMGQTSRGWNGLAAHPNGNIYATVSSGDLYLLDTSAKGLPNLDGGITRIKAGTGKGNGKSRVEFWTGQKLASGTNMQTSTMRCYIDENGYVVWVGMPTYADNTAAIAGGLPVGCEYKTATGDRKIVY